MMGGFRRCLCGNRGTHDEPRGRAGPRGIRVVCLRPEGIPETWSQYTEEAKQFGELKEFHDLLEGRTLMRRLPTLAEVANVAVFMASDHASAMTGTVEPDMRLNPGVADLPAWLAPNRGWCEPQSTRGQGISR